MFGRFEEQYFSFQVKFEKRKIGANEWWRGFKTFYGKLKVRDPGEPPNFFEE